MKRTGNIASNRIYNPQNLKPAIPFDADEADSAMERFIRQKYQDNNVGGRAQAPARHDTGTTGSTESDDTPPPLPPKTGSKFGFRSASSIFPMSSKAKREAAARAHIESEREQQRSPSPPVRNKASRVFGAAVGGEESHGDNLANKLVQLRQMGFLDDKRNLAILKEKGGNLEKTVEALVKSSSESGPAPRSRTPLSVTAGITIQRTREKEREREEESPKVSNNPFDMPSAPPQSSQSTGTLAHPNTQHINGNQYHAPNGTNPANPFGLAPSQSQYNLHQQYTLDQSFQNMSLGQSQTLFPNHTGGFPNRQPHQNTGGSPMPTIPQHFAPSVFDSQPQQQQAQQSQNYNPFLQQQAPQPQAFNQAGNMSPTNPYAMQQRAQTFPQQTYYDQSQQQQAYHNPNQQVQSPQQYQQPQMVQQQSNPYGIQIQQNQQYTQSPQQYMHFQSQPQQLLPQQTGRADKSTILALYNYPQLAPVAPQSQSSMEASQNQDQITQGFAGMPNQQQQRSVSSPLATYASGSRNPFLSGGNGPQASNGGNGMNGAGQGQTRHVSQESMSVDVGGWHGQNGRHSPDAFANLSARSMR
jgi:hypothetical protein